MPRHKSLEASKAASLAQMAEESFPEAEPQNDQQRLHEAQHLIGSRRYKYEASQADTLHEFDVEFMRIFGDKRIDQTFTIDRLRLVCRELLSESYISAPAMYDVESARMNAARMSDILISALAGLTRQQS